MLAVAQAEAEAAVQAAMQGASNVDQSDEAGPSNSTTGQAASVVPDCELTVLTLFGREEDCTAAELVIQQELEVSCSQQQGG